MVSLNHSYILALTVESLPYMLFVLPQAVSLVAFG